MDRHKRDPDRQSVYESTISVSFCAAHPSFLSETMKLRSFNYFSMFLLMIGNDTPSIHTRIIDYISSLHTA